MRRSSVARPLTAFSFPLRRRTRSSIGKTHGRFWKDSNRSVLGRWRMNENGRGDIRNPKIEIRNKRRKSEWEIREARAEALRPRQIAYFDFLFVSDFGFRISNLRVLWMIWMALSLVSATGCRREMYD